MLETLGIAAGQTAINQGVGMLNMEIQEEANKRQAEFQHNIVTIISWRNLHII